jgi:hypothetical protein
MIQQLEDEPPFDIPMLHFFSQVSVDMDLTSLAASLSSPRVALSTKMCKVGGSMS